MYPIDMKLGIHVLYIRQILPFKGFVFNFIRIFLVGISKNIYRLYFSQRKLVGRGKGGKVFGKGNDLIGKGIK